MANPTLNITNGPGQRDLEQAFLARNLGATATFSLATADGQIIKANLFILNFNFVTCHGPNYEIGGHLKEGLPITHNFVFAKYNAEERTGIMEFSNGG